MPDFDEPIRALNSAGKAVVTLKSEPQPFIEVTDNESSRILLNGHNGNLFLRAAKKAGQPIGDVTAYLDSDTGDFLLGGSSTNGDVMLCPAGSLQKAETATIHLSAKTKTLAIWGDPDRSQRVTLNGDGHLYLGGNDGDGDIVLYPSKATHGKDASVASIQLSAGNAETGPQIILRIGGTNTVQIDGKSGDIVFQNADCSEEFEVEDVEGICAGTVMIVGGNGRLLPATAAYDERVAGVVSGAGGHRPGIVLGRIQSTARRVPIALAGRVGVRVDAQYGPVRSGSLLTTSPTSGHAMVAADRERAFGAVIGKALDGLASGSGIVPALIALN